MRGMHGRLIMIDLNDFDVKEQKINEDILKRYIGGKGLGTFLLLEKLKQGTDPLSPQNILIFATGPAAGTTLAPASRFGVFSKSPLTGTYAESYSGGHVAPAMKKTGYDAFVITGAAQRPCYIHFSPAGANFHDAAALWGEETDVAEEKMLREVGVKGSQGLVIGPAGEKMIRFACIKNNRWRSAGRGGLGAVMGSKNLKGIVFSGDIRAPAADEDGLSAWSRDFLTAHKSDPGVLMYRNAGTPALVALTNTAGCFPTQYWSRGRLKGWERISAEYIREEMEVRSRACHRCFFACAKLTRVLKGRHRGLEVEGPEYETIYAFGGLCCLPEMEEIVYLNDLCDRWGIDTITAGNLAAFAIEAGLRGRLKDAPVYGDPDSIALFLQSVVDGKGEGALFGQGLREAARALELEELAVHVKGMEPAGYDPRVLKGMGLAYATSDRGACHLRTTFYKPELGGMIDPAQVEGKARLFVDFEDRLNIYDCMIFCRFYRDLINWEELIILLYLLTGERWSLAGLRRAAGRIQDATRLFNLREGITKADDVLPPRLLRETINDGENALTGEEMQKMLSDYYLLRGWTEEGTPLKECLE